MGYRKLLIVAAAATVAAPFVPSAQADVLSEYDWAPHVHISMDGQAYCDNSHTTIKLWGTFSYDSGLGADVTFTNSYNASPNGKHTKTVTFTETYGVTFSQDPDDPTVYSKNGDSGVGGNPYISIGFLADEVDGKVPIGDRIFVGRCVMGNSGGNQFKHVNADLTLPEHISSLIQQLDCLQKGAAVGVGVDAEDSGLAAEVYLDNNKNKVIHEATGPLNDGPAGVSEFGLQNRKGYQKSDHADNSAGGNPLVDLTWVHVGKDADGNTVREPIVFDNGATNGIHGVRCNKI